MPPILTTSASNSVSAASQKLNPLLPPHMEAFLVCPETLNLLLLLLTHIIFISIIAVIFNIGIIILIISVLVWLLRFPLLVSFFLYLINLKFSICLPLTFIYFFLFDGLFSAECEAAEVFDRAPPREVNEPEKDVFKERIDDVPEKAEEISFDPETYAKLTPTQKKLFDLRLKMVSSVLHCMQIMVLDHGMICILNIYKYMYTLHQDMHLN